MHLRNRGQARGRGTLAGVKASEPGERLGRSHICSVSFRILSAVGIVMVGSLAGSDWPGCTPCAPGATGPLRAAGGIVMQNVDGLDGLHPGGRRAAVAGGW